ncbi:AAA family ATPase [Bacillus cereus]|nr:AAA family ATPase [Bacillus cereus]
MEEVLELAVTPEKRLYYNEDSSFGIYSFTVDFEDIHKVRLNSYGNITAKGSMPELEIGASYTARLTEYKDPKYGFGYQLESIKQELPTTIEGQRAFLKQVLTALQVENIYEAYPDQDVIKLIQEDNFDYNKVKGLGEKMYQKIKKKIEDNLELEELFVWLNTYDIKFSMVAKLIKEFESPALLIQKLEENPYMLTKVQGIGFTKADAIAKQMGIPLESPHRIKSCIVYCIGEENGKGNAYINRKILIQEAQKLLAINKSIIEECLVSFAEGDKSVVMIINERRVTLRRVYEAEQFVAESLTARHFESKAIEGFDVDAFLDGYCKEHDISLTDEQRSFFHNFAKYNINFLIGYAGCGKSFLQTILLEMTKKIGLNVKLLAPTGKASKVLSAYTGQDASTIHRALGVRDMGDEPSMISHDVILVDESSMCDIFLVRQLLRGIDNSNARIVFIGDDFQLPSVQIGNFLYDCINSDVFPVTKLTVVFRQKDGGVLDIATKIREGEKVLSSNQSGKLRFGKDAIIHLAQPRHIVDGYKFYYKKMLERFDAEDIMVLSPTRKGDLGVFEINKHLQELANPPSDNKKEYTVNTKMGEVTYRVGDFVMNIANTYDLEISEGVTVDIFNGDTGRIVDINKEDKVVIIDFVDCANVPISFNDISKIVHSYCMTIHKSQGSGSPVVMVIADKSHTYQLNANLLYTGWTRAKKYLIALTQVDAMNSGIRKVASTKRKSFLGELLEELGTLAKTA